MTVAFFVLTPARRCWRSRARSLSRQAKHPGLFLASLTAAAAFIVLLAVIAGVLTGPIRTAGPRIWTVLFCTAAGAAWQVGALPLLATLLVQN